MENGKRASVLVVDDDKTFREMIDRVLEPIGYSCSLASGSSEAMDMLGRDRFDIVISDIRMEGKDGLELIKEAREVFPHLDFIAVTGHAAQYKYSDIIRAGASDFILKPFTLEELEAKLARIEREREMLEELKAANLKIGQACQSLEKTLGNAVETLARVVEIRDPYTAGHQFRVGQLAEALARELECSENRIMSVRMVGLVHDIGKISVPSEILSKPSRLKEAEFKLIQEHSAVGYDILKGIDFQWPIAEIVLQHHERMNGSGYPNGLTGPDIRLESKIIMVADVVEAISSHRPYRPALGIGTALEEISSNRGTLYDKTVVDACLEVFSRGFKL